MPKPIELDDTRVHVYVTRAIDRIIATREGGRNDQLNRQAYRIGMFVQAGRISEGNASSLLLQAAAQIGLDQRESIATIRSALTSARRAVP